MGLFFVGSKGDKVRKGQVRLVGLISCIVRQTISRYRERLRTVSLIDSLPAM